MKLFPTATELSQRENYKWWVLGALTVGTFITVIDLASLNIALPNIGTHFDANLPTVQWVVLGNALAITALLLPMGRLSDIVGRRQVYLLGFGIFAVAGVLSGLSTSLPMLISSRVLQGLGSAMIQANFMAMAIQVFPAKERGKVMGLIMSTVGFGGIAGPVFGGFLVNALGWRSIFFITSALGLLSAAVGAVVLDKRVFLTEQTDGHRPSFDWLGSILSGVALLLFLLVITNGYRAGWLSAPIVAGMIAFLLFVSAFIWWELRTASPMFELRLFKRKLLALASAAAWMSFLGTGSVLFIMPFYLQKVLGYSPTEVGLIFIPSSLCLAALSPLAGRLSDRFGWRPFTVGGLALSIAAMLIFSTTLTATSPLVLLIPLLMLRFTGHAFFNSPNSTSIFSAVEIARFGVVSALTQVLRNSGTVAGIALVTMVIVITMDSLGFEPSLDAVAGGQAGVAEAFVTGARRAFLILAGLMAVGLAFSLYKGQPLQEEEPLSKDLSAEPSPLSR